LLFTGPFLRGARPDGRLLSFPLITFSLSSYVIKLAFESTHHCSALGASHFGVLFSFIPTSLPHRFAYVVNVVCSPVPSLPICPSWSPFRLWGDPDLGAFTPSHRCPLATTRSRHFEEIFRAAPLEVEAGFFHHFWRVRPRIAPPFPLPSTYMGQRLRQLTTLPVLPGSAPTDNHQHRRLRLLPFRSLLSLLVDFELYLFGDTPPTAPLTPRLFTKAPALCLPSSFSFP